MNFWRCEQDWKSFFTPSFHSNAFRLSHCPMNSNKRSLKLAWEPVFKITVRDELLPVLVTSAWDKKHLATSAQQQAQSTFRDNSRSRRSSESENGGISNVPFFLDPLKDSLLPNVFHKFSCHFPKTHTQWNVNARLQSTSHMRVAYDTGACYHNLSSPTATTQGKNLKTELARAR